MSTVLNLLNTLAAQGIKLGLDNEGNLLVRGDKSALDQSLISKIKAAKLDIVAWLKSDKKVVNEILIPVVARDGKPLLTSYAQQRLWLLDQIDGGSAHYNMPAAMKLAGTLNQGALNLAFGTIIARHESLRTCFMESGDGQPLQVIQPAAPITIALTDLSAYADGERQIKLVELLAEEAGRVFDLSCDLMLRVQLLKMAADEHILLVTMHHIASDGWSMAILINEFSVLYQACAQGQSNPLPPLAIQYADYAHWQRNWLQGDVLEQQLDYWTTLLANLPVVHSLPLDHARPNLQSFTGDTWTSQIDAATSGVFNTLCQASGATLFMGLHAAFSVLLARHSNETDIVVGSPIANREQAEVAGLIGFFVNTLVLRCDLSGNPSFTDLLMQSKAMLLNAYAHQQVPFEQIVERLKPARSLSHSPLFQIMLVLQNNEDGRLELPGLTLSPVEPAGSVAKYDLTLTISESAQGLRLDWEYNTDLFEAVTIARMAQHFGVLLKALSNTPQASVFGIDMLSAAERRQLLVEWNDTATDYPHDQCIHQLFEAQAAQNPDAVAVVFEGQQLSYAELNAKANQLAHYLVTERQVKPDTLVGICIERSLEMVIAILGILKAGGAYVPLDPDYPSARLEYMLGDANLSTVLSQSHLLARTPIKAAQAVCLDDGEVLAQLSLQPAANIAAAALALQSSHLAYVIYTSGSTGNPKGVMVEHRALLNRIDWMDRHYGSSPSDRILQKTPFSFDVSVWEFVWPLSVGARIVLAKPEGHKDPLYLTELIRAQQITKLHFVPSMLGSMLALGDLSQCTSLRQVFCSGEALTLHHVAQFQACCPFAGLHNLYGPTEAAIDVSYQDCSQLSADLGSVPIGRPIHNIQLYVMNPQLVPQGVAGELHIGGVGLARGYLNRPELTDEKFIANPFHDASDPVLSLCSERLYKTGDLVRWLPDGSLEYLGRIDHQVKIRGFRIELGEIENALNSHPQVSDAVVLAKDSAAGDKRLVAYVVMVVSNDASLATQDQSETAIAARHALIEGLRQHLGLRLPEYMVPAAYVLLASLPLSPNGKIDRKALPEPDASQQQTAWVAPRSDLEQRLCGLWQEVLELERVGISDNFFRLGGHSLSATRLVARINQVFKVALPLRAVFHSPTLEALAQAVAQLDAGPGLPPLQSVPRDVALLPSYAQQRLWLLDRIDGGSAHYNMPTALKLEGALNQDALNLAFTTILARHESLRTCFTDSGDGQPLQVIQAAAPFAIDVTDLSAFVSGERQLKLAELLAEEASLVFDLSRDLMLRARLLRMAADEHILLVTMHHIASDGWSMAILINEFSALYQAYALGQPDPLPPLVIQYADYAHWQRNWLQGDVLEQQLGYWTTRLANLPVVHSLPLDHARPAMQSFVGDTCVSQIDAATSGALNALCQASGATLFMGLHAAFSVLLARYSNETDIVVGSPIANREQAEVAGLIGFFVNTLILRCDLSGNPDFTELLGRSKAMLLDAYAHQQVPFEQIVERLQPERSLSHGALFQVMLVLQNNEDGRLELPGLTLGAVEQGGGVAKYDLTLIISESAQGLSLDWQYNTDLFEAATIARMAQHFSILLKALVSKPQASVFGADMLGAAERHQLLVEWNDTATDYPHDKCIHQLFEAQAAQTPDAVAVVYEGVQLSYGELNAKANQLAHYLVTEKQVKPDTLVGICVERSLEMVIGILAILKAGGAYVPLDPDYPSARLEYMLGDANLATVLSQNHLLTRTPIKAEQAVCLDDAAVQQLLALQPLANITPQSLGLHAQHLAYVIYTSGSTGNPKGVLQTHQTVANLVQATALADGIDQPLRTLQYASSSFDVSIQEIATAWHTGGTLLLSAVEKRDLMALPGLLQRLCVERVFLPPAVLHWLAERMAQQQERLPHLREVFAAGEALFMTDTLARFFERHPDCQLWNHYGPTETHVATRHRVHGVGGAVPVGTPVLNLNALVLSAWGELAPVGVAGELLIGGAGLARGYLNRPELTAEKFITNPFHDASDPVLSLCSERLYKTGDLVRWLPDGSLEYMGRIDHQVKIRGFRIELGEIENALTSHAQVSDAVVLAKDFAAGDKRLVAYVVTNDASLATQDQSETARHALIEGLRQHLGSSLPDYMVPAAYVLLASLPLTPNGKVDRKALPEPDASQQQAAWVAPRSETEQRLCELWQEVLGLERVGISDNFFRLGGHSLSATRLVARINQAFKVVLPLRAVFQAQTLEALAHAVAHAVAQLDAGMSLPPLQSVPRDVALPPSYAQQRLWLLDRIDGGSAHYNMPAALRLDGALNQAALNRAFTSIIARHESLRTCFTEGGDGQPLQVIQPAAPFAIALTDLSAYADGERQIKLVELLAEDAGRIFDLSRDLMLRARLLRMAGDEHILLVTMHHIASDGWSMAILVNEFSALYQAYVLGQPDPLPPPAIQYADYAHWQRNWLQGEVLAQQLDYWTGQLANLPVVHSLPLDHARPNMQSFVGDTYTSQIDAATGGALHALCQASGATLFMGLHAAFSVLLARYSNETDIVVGSPIANREQAEVAGLIGFFVNTLILRCDLSGNPSFAGLLARSKAMLLDAYAHQQVPFEQIVERLQPARSLSHSPLFQVMLVLQNNEVGRLELPGLTLSPVEPTGSVAKYDLTLNISESAQGLTLDWEYNTDLFEAATIARMAQHFGVLLKALSNTPQASVFGIDMLSDAERRQLLVEWNDTATDYPRDKCIHELFEQQAAQNPEAVAVVFEGRQLSYSELNAKANQLAHYLVTEKQVKPDTLVGICVERSLEMVIGILGILKAGGAYVPLDPDYPPARLEYMLTDANLTTVLTQRHLLARTPLSAADTVCLDDARVQQLLALQPVANIVPQSLGLHAQHLAYVIYTSGSTGNPKASLLSHSGLANLAMAQGGGFAITPASRVLQFASIAFDAATSEWSMALSHGASIVLLSNAAAKSPDALSAVVEQYRVTHATLPPVLLPLLKIEKWKSVHTLIVAGDTCSGQMAKLWSADRTFINAYGPSEATVCTTMGSYQADQSRLHIGKPLQNMTVYVLTQCHELVPMGVAGELYIGGVGLARGYLNRPDLTAEKFITNPFHDASDPVLSLCSERLYKTGDLVRWLPDGKLEYLGRIDHQVKIRGFRIELGEIENALTSHAQVSDAVVLAKEAAAGDQRLVAYVVMGGANEDASLAAQDESDTAIAARHALIEGLRQHLGLRLPDYMVPAAYVLLASLPLTPNGKVDRKALPEPDVSQQQAAYEAPRSETEQRLCALWQEVLGLERVGITDNFFQVGGHSLLAVQLMSRIRQDSGVEIPLRTLFVAPTVEMLAASISAGSAGSAFPNLVPIRPTGNLSPLFLIHPGEGEIGYARAIAPYLDADLPVYALAASGFLDGEVALQSIAEMASTYLRAIRHVQAHGPYRVAGWSAGGTIAYEIARQLLDAGEVVEYLGLIDTTSDYSGLKRHLALPPGAKTEVDDAAILLASLAHDVPQSLLQELQALAASGAVTAMLERCRSAGIFHADIDTTTLRRHLAVRASIQRALFDYMPLPIPVRVTLFTAAEGARADLAQGWAALAQAGIEVLRVQGNHYSIMEAPHVQALGQALSESMLVAA